MHADLATIFCVESTLLFFPNRLLFVCESPSSSLYLHQLCRHLSLEMLVVSNDSEVAVLLQISTVLAQLEYDADNGDIDRFARGLKHL